MPALRKTMSVCATDSSHPKQALKHANPHWETAHRSLGSKIT